MAVGTAGKGGLQLRNVCEKKLNLFQYFSLGICLLSG